MALQKRRKAIPFTAGIDDKTSSIIKGDATLEILENANVKTRGIITKRPGANFLSNGISGTGQDICRMIEHRGTLYAQSESGEVRSLAGESIGNTNRQWTYRRTDDMPLGISAVVAIANVPTLDKIFVFHHEQGGGDNPNLLYSVVAGDKITKKNVVIPGMKGSTAANRPKQFRAFFNGSIVIMGLEKPVAAAGHFKTAVISALSEQVTRHSLTLPFANGQIDDDKKPFQIFQSSDSQGGIIVVAGIDGQKMRYLVFSQAHITSGTTGSTVNPKRNIVSPDNGLISNFCVVENPYNIPGFGNGFAVVLTVAAGFGSPSKFALSYVSQQITTTQAGPNLVGLPTDPGNSAPISYKGLGMVAHLYQQASMVVVFHRLANFAFRVAQPNPVIHYYSSRATPISGGHASANEFNGGLIPVSRVIEQNDKFYYLAALRDEFNDSGDCLLLMQADKITAATETLTTARIVTVANLYRYDLQRFAVQRFIDGRVSYEPPNQMMGFNNNQIVAPVAPRNRFRDQDHTSLEVLQPLGLGNLPGNEDRGLDWIVYKGQLVVAGSHLSVLGADGLRESAFLYSPQVRRVAKVGTGGKLKPGTYLMKFTYVAIGNDGETIESEPSPALTVICEPDGNPPAETHKITVLLDGFYFGKIRDYQLNCYVTEVNGTVYYRVASIPGGARSFEYSIQLANHITKPILYTDSGQDGNAGTQPCEFVEVFDDRLAITGGKYHDRVVFSKPDRFEFYESEVTARVARGNYSINGLKTMDSRLLIFKPDMVLAVAGPGPDLFSKGAYRPAQELPYKNGLRDQRSLVLTPMGLFYRSLEGTYLIDRGLNLTYIGSAIESDNALNVREAAVMDAESLVVFFTQAKTFAFDYVNKVWHTYTGQGYNAATNFGGVMHYAKGTSTFVAANVFTEGGTAYNLRFRTAWLNLAGITGFQRVWRATIQANNLGAYSLTLLIRYDYESAVGETLTFTADANDPEIEFLPARQRCKAMQLEFIFVGNNPNAEIAGVDFLVGIIGIKNRISPSKRGT